MLIVFFFFLKLHLLCICIRESYEWCKSKIKKLLNQVFKSILQVLNYLPFAMYKNTIFFFYYRNIQFFGLESQQKVTESFVVVIGLGGVGSHAASMLLRSGVGRLLLVDFDQVLSTEYVIRFSDGIKFYFF